MLGRRVDDVVGADDEGDVGVLEVLRLPLTNAGRRRSSPSRTNGPLLGTSLQTGRPIDLRPMRQPLKIPHLAGREKPLRELGLSPTDATWLTLVCYHSGVFTRRQYAELHQCHRMAAPLRLSPSPSLPRSRRREPLPAVASHRNRQARVLPLPRLSSLRPPQRTCAGALVPARSRAKYQGMSVLATAEGLELSPSMVPLYCTGLTSTITVPTFLPFGQR